MQPRFSGLILVRLRVYCICTFVCVDEIPSFQQVPKVLNSEIVKNSLENVLYEVCAVVSLV